MTILFRNAAILPGNGDWRRRSGQDLRIANGIIVEIGRMLDPHPHEETIDAKGLLLMPAFRNAHTHSPEMLGRGRAPMSDQVDWLQHAYGEGRDALDTHDIEHAIRLCARENIRGGAVAVTDHFRQVPMRARAVRDAAAAWAKTGLQAQVAINLRDRRSNTGTLLGVPGDVQGLTTAALLESVEALTTEPSPTTIVPGPSAPQRVTDELMIAMAAISRARGTILHMHLCECADDAAACRSLYGASAVTHLDRLGVLGPNVDLVHSVHIDDADIALVAAREARIVHSPIANLRLGSGVAPIKRALRAGVDVRLSTDGAGSNDGQSMLEAAKFALLAPRAALPRDQWLTPEEVLDMATARKRLEAGQPADIIAFDLGASGFVNAPDDMASNVVLAAREYDLVHVLGRGAWLMRDREPTL